MKAPIGAGARLYQAYVKRNAAVLAAQGLPITTKAHADMAQAEHEVRIAEAIYRQEQQTCASS